MTVVFGLIHAWRDINFTSAQTSDTERQQTERPSLTDIRLLTEAFTQRLAPAPYARQRIHTTLTYTKNMVDYCQAEC